MTIDHARVRSACVVALFATALGVRLFGITDTPLDFHPTKQYRSAITTRAFYFEQEDTIDDWRRDVARDSLRRIGIIVPTPQEILIATLYQATGGERVWYGRLLSSLCWLVGGAFLFLLGRRLASFAGALLGTAFYLLMPFGVVSSQSFQPDAPMVGAIAASLYLSVRYHGSPTLQRFAWAGVSAAVAVFIKPVAVFFVVAGFLGAAIGSSERRGDLRVGEMLGFLLVMGLPSLAFYVYQINVPGFSDWQRETSFVPSFMLEFRFWDGWQKRIQLSVGFTYFVGGLIGASLARGQLTRSLLAALWVGYFVMCLACTYKISTHDYYHLPLVPIVALSLTQVVDALAARVDRSHDGWPWRAATALAMAIGVFMAAGTSIQARRRVPDFQREMAIASEVGTLVNHSRATVFLAPFYGRPLMYYGEISGEAWPYTYDIRDEALWNAVVPTARERIEQMRSREQLDYFIVLDEEELDRQPELERVLAGYPLLFRSENYVIFDLR